RFVGRTILRIHTTLRQMHHHTPVAMTPRAVRYLDRERRSFHLARHVIVSSHNHAEELRVVHPELPTPKVLPIGWGMVRQTAAARAHDPGTRPSFLFVGTLD